GREDVALLAVRVVEQRDVRGPVRIVLDRGNLRGNAVLVQALEVDDAVAALVPTTLMPPGDVAVVVAASRLVQALGELLLGACLGDLGKVRDRHQAASSGCRLV